MDEAKRIPNSGEALHTLHHSDPGSNIEESAYGCTRVPVRALGEDVRLTDCEPP